MSGDMSAEQVAAELGVSEAFVKRHWRQRKWPFQEYAPRVRTMTPAQVEQVREEAKKSPLNESKAVRKARKKRVLEVLG